MVSIGRSPLGHHYGLLSILILLQNYVGCTYAQTDGVLKCATGWNSNNNNNELKEIPADWINDGYCDCPFDGIDEPNTDACSGSQSWPGVVASPSGGATDQQQHHQVMAIHHQ